jgi:TetR/AcrR family transcriptional repressor of nem operon
MIKSSTTSDDILACARSLIVTGGYKGFSDGREALSAGLRIFYPNNLPTGR